MKQNVANWQHFSKCLDDRHLQRKKGGSRSSKRVMQPRTSPADILPSVNPSGLTLSQLQEAEPRIQPIALRVVAGEPGAPAVALSENERGELNPTFATGGYLDA